MKIKALNNAVQVSDIDLENDEDCLKLGRIVASECVVFVDDSVSERRLFDLQCLWGQPSQPIMHKYVAHGLLRGRHWREFQVHLAQISRAVDEISGRTGMLRVSFEKNKKGRAKGVFTNGKLDWHCDNQSIYDGQRIVGLMSLWGSKNSQTSFLCTAKAYDGLSHEDKTMVDELYSVWKWDGGKMSEDLAPSQMLLVRYAIVPHDGLETPLVDSTATGIKGLSFPSHSFSHFKGMSQLESQKYQKHLWKILNKPENIYHHNWQDGQLMFMDQNITLHARPTDVLVGNNRTMSRMNSYLDKLFPDNTPSDFIQVNGKKYSHDEFVEIVDTTRREEYYGCELEQNVSA